MCVNLRLVNGLSLIYHRIPGRKLAFAKFFVRVGSCFEPEERKGISHFLENTLFYSSKKYLDVDYEASKYGAFLLGRTDVEWTSFYYYSFKRDFTKLMDILLDIIFSPSIPSQKRIDEGKVWAIGGIEGTTEDLSPKELSIIKLIELLIGKEASNIGGKKEIVKAMKRGWLIEWHKKYFSPANVLLVISGDIEIDHIIKMIENIPIGDITSLIYSPLSIGLQERRSSFIYKRHNTHTINIAVIQSNTMSCEIEIVVSLISRFLRDFNCIDKEIKVLNFSRWSTISILLTCCSVNEVVKYTLSLLKKLKLKDFTKCALDSAKSSAVLRVDKISHELESCVNFLGEKNLYLASENMYGFEPYKQRIKTLPIEKILVFANEIFCPENIYVSYVGGGIRQVRSKFRGINI